MALSDSTVDNDIGIKVEGDLTDFQIIEEGSDSDDGDETVCDNGTRTVATVPSLPPELLKPSSPPVYGTVSVTNSENVQFGNNTYFNGPVTIKQVIQSSSGCDNPSYVHTEDKNSQAPRNQQSKNESGIKTFQIQLWHKLTFSAVCIIALGGVCAIISIVVSSASQDSSTTDYSDDDSTNSTKVEGLCYDLKNLKIILFSIILVPLILLMSCVLLTRDASCGGSKRISVNVDDKTVTNEVNYYNGKDDPLLIAPDHLRIVPRTDWLAQPVENELDKIRQPVPWVIITHTATESCRFQSECVLRVRTIQMFHVESKKWYDIGYNFLVGGDGSAYYGRGWDFIGAHTLGYNRYSIGIAFIGTFNNESPPEKQLEACKKLLKIGVEQGKLTKDYKLFAHRQLASTLSPGDKLFDIIKEWPHFVKNFTDIKELLPKY